VSSKGQEVKDFLSIVKNYTHSAGFYIDFFSLFGNSNLRNVLSFTIIFGFLKILRVFRVGKLIKRSNVSRETKSILNLVKLFFYMIVWLHVNACFFYATIGINKDVYEQYTGVSL